MKQLRIHTVGTSEEGGLFSISIEDLAIDTNGGVWIDINAPIHPADQEAVNVVNYGDRIYTAQEEVPMDLVRLMQRGESWQNPGMVRLMEDDDEEEGEW